MRSPIQPSPSTSELKRFTCPCWPTPLLLCILAVLGLTNLSHAGGREKDIAGRPMLSQDYIDTAIQRAYEKFSMAMTESATTGGPEQAVTEAKRVIQRMKNLAKTDVNRNYILWKVSELEYQVYLEERDIVDKEQRQKIARMNELVDLFNKETAKERPDFVALAGIQEQLALVNQEKADEVAVLIERRSAGVSKALQNELAAAMSKGDLNRARKTLDYCETNRGHLTIAESQYTAFGGTLQARVGVIGQKRYVEEDMASVTRLNKELNLREAWTTLGLVDRKLCDLKGTLSAAEASAYQAKRQRLTKVLDATEDSLVDAAIKLYNQSGRAATQEYVERTLKRYGVSRDKLAVIDQAIMGDAVAETRAADSSAMSEEYVALTDAADASGGSLILRDLSKKARIRAQEREDSAMIAQEEAQADAKKQLEKADHDKQRQEARAQRKEERRLAHERKRGGASENVAVASVSPEHVSAQRKAAEQALAGSRSDATAGGGPSDQARAQQNIVLIYALIERSDGKGAWERFQSLHEMLQKYVCAEAFATLEATVKAAYGASLTEAR